MGHLIRRSLKESGQEGDAQKRTKSYSRQSAWCIGLRVIEEAHIISDKFRERERERERSDLRRRKKEREQKPILDKALGV